MRWRELLPWRAFAIETSWTPEVAAGVISKQIDEPHLYFPGEPFKPTHFVGSSSGDREFHFRRRYSNRRVPMIRALVEPSRRGGALVRVHRSDLISARY
jgi:hypothetical protein